MNELLEQFKKRYENAAADTRFSILEELGLECIYDGDGNDLAIEVIDWVQRLIDALERQ